MTTEQATRAAILSAVRAFVEKVERKYSIGWSWQTAMRDELAALERAAAEGEPEGGSQETDRCPKTYTAQYDGRVWPCVLPFGHQRLHEWAAEPLAEPLGAAPEGGDGP